jgi:hypothetical protein
MTTLKLTIWLATQIDNLESKSSDSIYERLDNLLRRAYEESLVWSISAGDE